MDDYVEDYSYNNNFWMKSGVLYTYSKSKFVEYMSVGKIFERLSKLSKEFSENVAKAIEVTTRLDIGIEIELDKKSEKKKKTIDVEQEKFYIPLEKPDNSTRSEGIKVLLGYFQRLANSMNSFSDYFKKMSNDILDKQDGYIIKIDYEKQCDANLKIYKESLNELNTKKKLYYEAINKAIEYHLSHQSKPGKNKEKYKEIIFKRKNEYLAQVKEVEKIRVEYIELQGHVFSTIEEFERNCTNEFKLFLMRIVEKINNSKEDFGFNESEVKIL